MRTSTLRAWELLFASICRTSMAARAAPFIMACQRTVWLRSGGYVIRESSKCSRNKLWDPVPQKSRFAFPETSSKFAIRIPEEQRNYSRRSGGNFSGCLSMVLRLLASCWTSRAESISCSAYENRIHNVAGIGDAPEVSIRNQFRCDPEAKNPAGRNHCGRRQRVGRSYYNRSAILQL